jgi:hypothetical protein
MVITALLAAALACIFPSRMGVLPAGMKTPIIALELARSTSEIEAMFGPAGPQRAAWAALMNAGNRVDLLFMLAYGALYVSVARALAPGGRTGTILAMLLGVLAPLLDLCENLQLFAIVDALGGDYERALARLCWVTGLKWLANCAVLLSWVPGLLRAGRLGQLLGALALLTTGFTVVAAFQRGMWAECMALSVLATGAGASLLVLGTPASWLRDDAHPRS